MNMSLQATRRRWSRPKTSIDSTKHHCAVPEVDNCRPHPLITPVEPIPTQPRPGHPLTTRILKKLVSITRNITNQLNHNLISQRSDATTSHPLPHSLGHLRYIRETRKIILHKAPVENLHGTLHRLHHGKCFIGHAGWRSRGQATPATQLSGTNQPNIGPHRVRVLLTMCSGRGARDVRGHPRSRSLRSHRTALLGHPP